MLTTRSFGRLVSVMAVGISVLTGCSEKKPQVPDTNASQKVRHDTITSRRTPPVAADVMALIKRYQFDGDSEPVSAKRKIKADGNNQPIDKANDPKMTIAMALPSPMPLPGPLEILARVKSQRAYKGLGVMPHDNYIVRNTADRTVWMFPGTGGKPVQLYRDDHTYSDGDMKRPRLVYEASQEAATKTQMILLGVCLDDPNCGGHCGYSGYIQ